jgi:hypothetical protein
MCVCVWLCVCVCVCLCVILGRRYVASALFHVAIICLIKASACSSDTASGSSDTSAAPPFSGSLPISPAVISYSTFSTCTNTSLGVHVSSGSTSMLRKEVGHVSERARDRPPHPRRPPYQDRQASPSYLQPSPRSPPPSTIICSVHTCEYTHRRKRNRGNGKGPGMMCVCCVCVCVCVCVTVRLTFIISFSSPRIVSVIVRMLTMLLMAFITCVLTSNVLDSRAIPERHSTLRQTNVGTGLSRGAVD